MSLAGNPQGKDSEKSMLVPMEVEASKGLSIRFKLSAFISGLVALSLALLSTFILFQARNALIQETTHRAIVIGKGLADYSSSAVLSNNFLDAAKFARDAVSNEAMVYAVLADLNDTVVAADAAPGRKAPGSVGQNFTAPSGEEIAAEGLPSGAKVMRLQDEQSGENLLAFVFPIIHTASRERVGTASIALSQGKIQDVVKRVTTEVALLGVLFLVLAVVASLLLASLIVRPVQRITQGALAIGGGNLDTQIKVASSDELGVLARSFNAMTHSLKAAQEELVEKQLLKQELGIAHEIQQGLLPKKIPQIPGYEIAAFYAPAKEVGGDYYDFIRMGPTRLAFAVADVSGKSVPGSLGMTMARSVLRAQALSQQSPGETLRKTNEVIQPDIRRGMFVTAFYSVLDATTHTVASANAGHNPAFLLKKGGQMEEIGPEGIALGLVTAQQFYIEEHSLTLDRGDVFILYTDGITEAMNPASEEWGEDRFKESIRRRCTGSLEAAVQGILEDIKAFVAGAPPHDDITLLLVRRSL